MIQKEQYDALKKIRNDFGLVHPATKIFEDKRKKREKKYPKQHIEKEFLDFYEENEGYVYQDEEY